jgi:hypothetical protein
MSEDKGKITVYYDGACPSCVRDRRHYEKLAGKSSEQVCWFDIVLVQRKSEFWPAVLSWLSGGSDNQRMGGRSSHRAHRHGNIKTVRPALLKELPYGIPP